MICHIIKNFCNVYVFQRQNYVLKMLYVDKRQFLLFSGYLFIHNHAIVA